MDYIINLKILYLEKTFNFFNLYTFWNIEDILVLLFIYSLIKYIIVSSINELVWPTQIFNKKHNINWNIIKFRSYYEYILKNKNYNKYNYIFINFFYNYKFIFRV